VTLILVRHGHAGDRKAWDGPDQLRPLSERGWRQANRVAELVSGFEVNRLLSSPYVRCRETLGPASKKLGLEIEDRADLAEGTPTASIVALARATGTDTVVWSSHGDVIPDLLEYLVKHDKLRLPNRWRCPKGSVWVLSGDGSERFVTAKYHAPA
jgi:broad specificity phosphatase PhoE